MQSIPHPLGRRHSSLLLAIGSILVVVTMSGTSAVSLLPPTKISAPYPGGSKIATVSSMVSGGAVNISVTPTAHPITGKVGMAMSASHHLGSCSAGSFFCSYVYGTAGFGIPFRVTITGAHNVSSNWSLAWTAAASCKGCSSGFSFVYASLSLSLLDLTNGTTVNSTSTIFLNLRNSGNSTALSSGSVNLTLYTTGQLLRGHKYEIKTYVIGLVSAFKPSGGTTRAHLDFASPMGGTLNSVVIR